MDSDELFDEYIEYDDDDSGKENMENLPPRQPRTTKDQFIKMESFVNQHDETITDKVTYKLLWENLAAELNDIGPPDHSVSEWKRIWSTHKHNKKRKLLMDVSDTEELDNVSSSDAPSRLLASSHESSEISNKLGVVIEHQSEISKQMSVISENQTEMIAIQKVIYEELQRSNNLLQEIVEKQRSCSK